MTGDYNITAIHVEAALQQCVTFVGMNTTLEITIPPQLPVFKICVPVIVADMAFVKKVCLINYLHAKLLFIKG